MWLLSPTKDEFVGNGLSRIIIGTNGCVVAIMEFFSSGERGIKKLYLFIYV